MIYLTILSEIPQNLNSTLLPHIEEQKHQLAEVYHISHGLKKCDVNIFHLLAFVMSNVFKVINIIHEFYLVYFWSLEMYL